MYWLELFTFTERIKKALGLGVDAPRGRFAAALIGGFGTAFVGSTIHTHAALFVRSITFSISACGDFRASIHEVAGFSTKPA